jgi:hypothetical protein
MLLTSFLGRLAAAAVRGLASLGSFRLAVECDCGRRVPVAWSPPVPVAVCRDELSCIGASLNIGELAAVGGCRDGRDGVAFVGERGVCDRSLIMFLTVKSINKPVGRTRQVYDVGDVRPLCGGISTRRIPQ